MSSNVVTQIGWSSDVGAVTQRRGAAAGGATSLSSGWASCPVWSPKTVQDAQHIAHVVVRAPARP